MCHDGIGKNSAHRRSLAFYPTPPPCQHQCAAAGIFWRLDLISFAIFAHVYFTTSDKFFNRILFVTWWERQKLIPQTVFSLQTCTTALLTSMVSIMLILKVRFDFLCLFRSCLLYYIWLFFLILYFLWHDGKDENSAHRLSLVSWLTSPVSVAYICYYLHYFL